MMGQKTYREVKEQLFTAMSKSGGDPIKQLQQEIRLLEVQPEQDPLAIETLTALLNGLQSVAKTKKVMPKARRKVG